MASLLLALGAAVLGAGCAGQRERRPIVVEPAAHAEGDSRPVDIKPPFDLADNYEQAVVRLVADVTCTGTLIEEDLVLTAHHCVVRHDAAGNATRVDVDPSQITVELGTSALPWGEVGVRAVVTPDCGYGSGDGDIAVLVLRRKLVGVATISPKSVPLRVASADQPETLDEKIEARGYGRCASSSTSQIELATRSGKSVEIVTPRNFYGVAAICRGDSGGPAFIATQRGQGGERDLALVGVTSASVMSPDDPASGFSVFTRIDAWPQLLFAAREIAAHGATPSELPPYRSCDVTPQKPHAPHHK